jgi:hypothetical protein
MVLAVVVTANSMVLLPKVWTQQGKCMSPVSGVKTVDCDILSLPKCKIRFFP